jgi:DNA polymerase (family 10)
LEINASPQRLDLNDVQAKMAKERGAKLVVSTDAHNRYQLQYMDFGIGLARRAWLGSSALVNALPLQQFQAWLHER